MTKKVCRSFEMVLLFIHLLCSFLHEEHLSSMYYGCYEVFPTEKKIWILKIYSIEVY